MSNLSNTQTIYDQDLSNLIKVQYIPGNLFSQDNGGNEVGVRCFYSGEPNSIAGNIVTANVIRADGATVALTGAIYGDDNNIALVNLTGDCYEIPGVITIIIKITGEYRTTTIGAFITNVYVSATDTVIDPGTILPSIQTLISNINTAVASIPADYSSLWTSLAPAFSTSTAYEAGQYVTYNGGLYRFTTAHSAGAWNSSHVTAINVGGELVSLKSTVNDITELETISPLYGHGLFNSSIIQYWLASGNYVAWIKCEANKPYRIGKDIDTASFKVGYTKTTPAKDVSVFGYTEYSVSATSVDYKTGTDAEYLIVCTGTTDATNHFTFKQIYPVGFPGLLDRVDTLEENEETTENTIEKAFDSFGVESKEWTNTEVLSLTFTNGYMAQNGSISSSTSLQYSNKFNVSPGDIIGFTIPSGQNNYLRFVTAFDSSDTAVSDKGAASVSTYTVPNGISALVVTVPQVFTGSVKRTIPKTGYVIQRKPFGTFIAKGNLSTGQELSIYDTNVNKNICQAFSADITSFSKLLIGRKTSSTIGYWITIDGTNVTVWRDNTAANPVAHGLTIENNIQVRIKTKNGDPDEYTYADIVITSNGKSYTLENVYWVRTYGNPFAASDGSTLTNCVLAWNAMDLSKNIFAFGDSYYSYMSVRWVYYLAKDGFANNVLTNAYAGEQSANAINSLLKLVPAGEPKYVFWCLGMNDGSDNGEPSAAWVKGRDEVLNICTEYGITPVFGTIPTVPTINHEYKNAWIRSSGYKYVDFAKAVGATSNGTWYTGMLSNDGVHPTEEGAKALYGRVLTDFPEIMIY